MISDWDLSKALEEKRAAVNEYDERLSRWMTQLHSSSLIEVEAIKLRISHFERIIILNASVVALTFTFVTGFQKLHNVRDIALSMIIVAWALMVTSIVCALVANFFNVTCIRFYAVAMMMWQQDVHAFLMDRKLPSGKFQSLEAKDSGIEPESESYKSHREHLREYTRYSGLGLAIGILSQALTLAALIAILYCGAEIIHAAK